MITTGIICTRCGKPLELEETEGPVDDDYGATYYFVCPHCGARYECTEVSDSQKSDYEFYDDEKENIHLRIDEPDIMNGHCINCGHKVSMSNNFMLSDYDDSIVDEGDDKMNFVLNQCPYCGMMEVRWETSENEKKDYAYWQESSQ